MALLWIEGFEGFGIPTGVAPSPTGIVSHKYPSTIQESQMRIRDGRYGYAIEMNSFMSEYIRSPNLTTDNTLIIGCAIKVSSFPVSNSRIFSFFDNVTEGVNLRVNVNGTLAIYRGASTLLGTSVNSIDLGTWYYIELKVVTHNSTGTVDLHVNESSWLSLSDQDTQEGSNAYHTAFRIGKVYPMTGTYYDDLYLLDSTGSINNDFLGNRVVQAIRPNAAGDSSQWTPSAGNNYETVDEVESDEDTTYVETSTTTDKDLYNYGPVTGLVSIDGIQIMTEVRVTSGSMDFHTVIKSGSTEDDGSADTISSTDYATSQRIEELNPDTLAKWTTSEIDDAQFGVKAI